MQLTEERTKNSHCMCNACKDGVIHKSDCAVHNMPAEPNGECNCEISISNFSEELSYLWTRALGYDWTENNSIYDLYLAVSKELTTELEAQTSSYRAAIEKMKYKRGFFEIDPQPSSHLGYYNRAIDQVLNLFTEGKV